MGDWPILSGFQKVAAADTQLNTAISSVTALDETNPDYEWTTWHEQYSSTPFDAQAILLRPLNYDNGFEFLFEIGIGPSGTERVLIEKLLWSPGYYQQRHPYDFMFPIYIPEGSRLSMRLATDSTGSPALGVQIMIFGGSFLTQSYHKVCNIGADWREGEGLGGVMVDAGPVANTKGDWHEIGRATDEISGIILVLGNRDNSGRPSYYGLLDLAFGEEGSEQILIKDYAWSTSIENDGVYPSNSPFLNVRIPEGTRVAARTQCSGTDSVDRLIDVIIYGVA
jgi:hypothetical protein